MYVFHFYGEKRIFFAYNTHVQFMYTRPGFGFQAQKMSVLIRFCSHSAIPMCAQIQPQKYLQSDSFL